MDSNNLLGEALEKGQSAVQNTGKIVAGSAMGGVKAVAGQILGDSSKSDTNEADAVVSDRQSSDDKAQTDELVKELYAPSKFKNNQNPADKEQSEKDAQAELTAVRKKLHDEVYYQSLVNPPKPQEERPAEKVEKEKKQEMQDLQKKEAEKPAPIAVQRAQQSAEKFRGVAG